MELRDRLSRGLDLSCVLNAKCIILGVLDNSEMDLINNIFVVCKRYIYTNNFLSKKLKISEVIHKIQEIIEIEYNIAIKRDINMTRFVNKWDMVKACLS